MFGDDSAMLELSDLSAAGRLRTAGYAAHVASYHPSDSAKGQAPQEWKLS